MGEIIIYDSTPKNPISLVGKLIGICYNSRTDNEERNYNRGLHSMKLGHGRVMEYCTVWLSFKGFSAKVIRELYTHIGGAPTRTQASTRYINYNNFKYVVPPSIAKNENAVQAYHLCMENIKDSISLLCEKCDIPKEDANMLLPLGMTTDITAHYNFRTLVSMAEQRLSKEAYWEFRDLMHVLMDVLSDYSEQWKILVDTFMRTKEKN